MFVSDAFFTQVEATIWGEAVELTLKFTVGTVVQIIGGKHFRDVVWIGMNGSIRVGLSFIFRFVFFFFNFKLCVMIGSNR